MRPQDIRQFVEVMIHSDSLGLDGGPNDVGAMIEATHTEEPHCDNYCWIMESKGWAPCYVCRSAIR